MNYYKKLYNFFFLFNFFFFTIIFCTSECLNNNQISIFSFDIINKYLIFISFVIFCLSYYSMNSNFFFEKNIIFVSLFIFSVILFSINNILFFFIILERVLIPIIFFFYYFGEYKSRYTSLSYIFLITLIFGSPFLMFILFRLKNRMEIYIKSFFLINNIYFFLLILRFLIKLPIYRFHYWLPKAHVDAPIRRSIILARIILKYRRYRLIRSIFFLKIFNFNYWFFLFIFLLRRIRYFLIAYICVQILDLKVLIAFSSVSHMSFSIIRNINCNFLRLKRSIYIYIGHRLISPLIFFISYILYILTKTRLINRIYRIRKSLNLKNILVSVLLMNLRFPPFINFVSEIFIFSSSFFLFFIIFFFFFFGFFFNRIYHVKLITILLNKNIFLKTKNFLITKFLFIIFFFIYNFTILSVFLFFI